MKNILFAIIFAVVLQFSTAEDNVTTTTPTPSTTTSTETSKTSEATPVTPVPVATTAVALNPVTPIYNYTNKTKILCNYNKNLPTSRSDKYSLDDVDSTLCSHVLYNSAYLDSSLLTIDIKSLGSEFDNLLKLKAKGLRVILSLGSSSELKTSEAFSRIVSDGSARTAFVTDTVDLLKKFGISGLNINWEFPTCWEGYCAKNHGSPSDKRLFVNLLRDLRAAFAYYGFQLMISVSPLEIIAERAYEISKIADYVDFINLQTYDYNNQTYSQTSIHSAFQGNPSTLNTITYWRARGVPAKKLIVGIPTFGRTFTLAKETWNMVGAPAVIGKTTGIEVPGMAAYFEICKNLDYQFVEKVGSFAYKGDQWVSFDDVTSIKMKGEYIKKNNLAGAMITSLDTDDYSGTYCGQGKYPLIRTLRESLGL